MELTEDQRLYLQLVFEQFRGSGKWPVLRDVQRQMVQQTGRSVDVTQVVNQLPPAVHPFTSHLQNEAILNVAALTLVDDAAEELGDFLALLKLAVEKYLGPEEAPTISSEDLAGRLGLNELRLRKVGALLRLEGLITSGGVMSESPYEWGYGVSDCVHRFASVETIEEYLEARDRPVPLSLETAVAVASEAPTAADSPSTADGGTGLDQLHPDILAVARRLFDDGHYPQAILEAFKAVEVRVRKISALDVSGRDLMARAFTGEPPLIRVGLEPGQSGRDEQEGFKLVFMGAIQGIRNPKAHGLVRQESPHRAFEYLAFASLLMHRLDDGLEAD